MKKLSRLGQKQRVLDLLGRNGIMRLSEFLANGIHAPTLARLVNQGTVTRPSRGLYELDGAEISMGHSLAEAAKRVPKGVICLVSALAFHQITLQSPNWVWVAIGENSRKPKLTTPPVRFVRFGSHALSTDVETHIIDSVPVNITSAAKTVVDCFRFRNTVGLDVALEALRMSLRKRKAKPDEIAKLAHKLRIWSVLRPYIEGTMADEG